MKSWLLFALAALLAILVACGPEDTTPAVVEPPRLEPTETPAPPPTLTSTHEPERPPEPAATNTPAPTATSEPMSTPTVAPAVAPDGVQDLTVRRVSEDSLTLEWELPANSDVAPVEEYEVTRDISLLPDRQQFVSETTFTDSGLAAGTEHKYRIRAIGIDGTQGAEVDIVVFTLDSPTPTPTPVSTPTPPPQPHPKFRRRLRSRPRLPCPRSHPHRLRRQLLHRHLNRCMAGG